MRKSRGSYSPSNRVVIVRLGMCAFRLGEDGGGVWASSAAFGIVRRRVPRCAGKRDGHGHATTSTTVRGQCRSSATIPASQQYDNMSDLVNSSLATAQDGAAKVGAGTCRGGRQAASNGPLADAELCQRASPRAASCSHISMFILIQSCSAWLFSSARRAPVCSRHCHITRVVVGASTPVRATAFHVVRRPSPPCASTQARCS
jgi:hypothetical protein